MSCPQLQGGQPACACAPPVKNKRSASFYFILALMAGLLLLSFNHLKGYESEALQAQSLSMIFVMGFLTGLHCVGMCGGLLVTYLHTGQKKEVPEWQLHGQYALAKIFSYASLGAVFGGLGALVQFSLGLKSNISIIGGVLLLLIGAKTIGLLSFPAWSTIGIGRLKHARFTHPVTVGLLNGFMLACAPLQALYLLAAGLGDPLKGALMLAVFAIGTLPIFLFYGFFMGSIRQLKRKWSDVMSAGILVVFGLLMINRGIAMGSFSGQNAPQAEAVLMANKHHQVLQKPQILQMKANRNGWSEKKLYFQKGRLIRWEIEVAEITLCNKTITLPELHLAIDLEEGLNVIEFDPGRRKKIKYTCWMGMMSGSFVAE